jgi:dolichyl-phosphate beta-glucosyltransferase
LSSAPAFILQSWTTSPYLTTLLLGPPLLLLIFLYPALLYLSPGKTALPTEAYFYATASEPKAQLPLPKLVEDSKEGDEEVQLSVVIPAFNEESRLPKMLKETVTHLEELRKKGKNVMEDQSTGKTQTNGHSHALSSTKQALKNPLLSYEILIIDDGSKDDTPKEALSFAKANRDVTIRLVKMGRNCGKGAAVRHGVLHSRGQLIIFCDADGATRFSDLSALATELDRIMTPAGHGIVCGSRAHLVGSEAVVKVSVS